MLESLEARRLLAAAVTIDAGGKLSVQGGSKGFNNITVIEAPAFDPVAGHVYVHMEYSDPNNGTVVFDTLKTGVTNVIINARNNGSDVKFLGTTLNSQIQGGSGVDYIQVNDSGTGSSKVTAGKGNDLIDLVRINKTFVDAGDGDDQIYVNSDVKPVYNNDTGMFESPDQNLTIALSAEQVTIKAGGGNDVIIVYDGRVTLDGGGGSDTLIDESTGLGVVTVAATNVETSTSANPGM